VVFFSLTERVRRILKNKYTDYAIIYAHLTQYIYNTRSKVNSCWVDIVRQVTTLSDCSNVRRLTKPDMIHILHWSSCKAPVILVTF
jgi:hypothetical protein